MDEIEEVAKRLFGRGRNRYDYYSLSLDVRDSLMFGNEIGRESFEEQVRKIIFKEDEENDENR